MHTLKKFDLSGKVAIVSGGAGYFGKPIVLALAEAGAHVIAASRDEEKCKNYAADLNQKGLSVEGRYLDLSDESSIIDLASATNSDHKKIDILINNAVSREGFKNLNEITKEEWEKSQQINSTGLMLMTKAILKFMCERRSGVIVNVGSIQGAVGPHFPVYGNTGMTSPVNYTYDKWGMVGFTKWIANYYAKFNIRANCISPGGYGPGIAESIGDSEFAVNYKRLTPMGRFADDEDIKGPIVFLSSDASSYVTGQNLLVDGGWTSW
ncbi:MAG: SDR family oxidoreductase [Chitinophagaceae bacterium]|nr:SDR family oxidoreductase [Chitinophagaceae bacterium]